MSAKTRVAEEPLTPVETPPAIDPENALATMLERLQKSDRIATPEAVEKWTLQHVLFPQLKRWGFESRFRVEIAAWNCPGQEAAFGECRRLLQGVGAVVALVGVRGAGKTTIGAQLALEIARRNHLAAESAQPHTPATCSYAKLSALAASFKPLYSDFGTIDSERLASARASFCRLNLAVIDELHDCDEMRVASRVLVDLIDRRYAGQLDTVLISNQTVQTFRASVDDSVISRITEHGVIIPCEWESWRVRLARQ